MSAAAADAATPPVEVPVKSGKKKKLILMLGVAVLILVLAGVGAVLYLKNKAAHAAADAGDDETATATHKSAKADPSHPPTFLPLDPFVVNLADKDADRYAQIGIVLEIDSALFADQMKAYMPAIRNSILMILAHKNSRELLERSGKEQLAEEILRETVRPMGIEIAAPEPVQEKAADGDAESAKPEPKPKAPKRPSEHNPVRHVHFSNFIIQ